ncbi:antibiotic transporter [Sulfolobus sp. S-194]|uniref:MMPL family transporter n=1 Tax=Sulfolobus sp. S-194 TaxID=2512240 RepID=UPI001436D10E|nr:MMPL family transporter [Sulfolobus sp. S-194]QIW24609.1 antibiotic transporter [Sulfolobus sp. S-194]
MFDGLAKFIVKRWYIVIIIWIILIILATPLSSLFLKSVSYQVTISVPGSTSAKAENIVSNYFKLLGASGSNGVLIIEGNVSHYSSFLANLTSYGNISIYDFYTIEKGILNTTLSKLYPEVDNLSNILLNISKSESNTSIKLSNEYSNLTIEINKLEELRNGTLEAENGFINISETINSTALKIEQLHNALQENYTAFSKIHNGEIETNQTIYNLSKFLFVPVSYFLEVWVGVYNQTHNVTLANQIAYEKVYPQLPQEEKPYFSLFYTYWSNNEITPLNVYLVADEAVYNASEHFFNITQFEFVSFVLHYINITNFNNISVIEKTSISYFNYTYNIPLELAKLLLTQSPFQVLISIYEEKTGLPTTFLEEVFNSTNFNEIALQQIISKVNSTTERLFIQCVYENISKTPQQFAINYISLHYNVSRELVATILSFNATEDYINYVSGIASNKTNLPQWFFIQLIRYDNVSNLTAYLFSSHLTKLSSLLQKSNLTTLDLAYMLQTNVSVRDLAIKLIVNYANFTPILNVNKSELISVILSNESVEQLIASNAFPIEPISNITDNLYSSNLFLVFMKGNFTHQEAINFQEFIQTKTGLKTYLTGGEPISHQLKKIASNAYSIAIPVGIILAIILAGIYFRSFVAAIMPLTIYISAYLVASVFLWLVVIKILNITVNFLTPSEVLLLALGLGTDYVVFIAARYIEERRKKKSKEEAVYEAVKWGGRAVTITALIVMLSFLFIYIYKIPFFSDTAISDMLAVVIVWLSAITLFPAILRGAGDKLFFPRKFTESESKRVTIKRPSLYAGIISAIVVISVVVALFTPLTLNVLALLPPSQATQGVTILSNKFTSANIFPIYVVIPYNGTFNQTAYDYAVSIYKELSSIPGVTAVQSPVSPYGGIVNYSELGEYNYTEYFSHGYMLFVVNQKYQPFSNQAFQIVQQIEKIIKNGYVGGGPVDAFNIYNFVKTNFFVIVGEIAVTMFILLLIMTRSIAVSGVVIYTILSAVAITLALERLIFTNVLGYSIFAVVPIFLVSIIIGIGMDYNIFLIARVHEELEKGNNMEAAVEISVSNLRLTIAFLGLIFAGTLGSLMLVKASILQELGFAFAVAAILETTVLWSHLSPSLLLILYRRFKIRPKLIV